jgi:hypothetical protein
MNATQSLVTAGIMFLAPYLKPGESLHLTPTNWLKVDKDGKVLPPNAAPFASDISYPPGTPAEGSKLTTETKELKPCFAAVYPACPGHWETNRTEWVFRSGRWITEPKFVDTFVWPTNTWSSIYTNTITTNQISTITFELTDTTNTWQPLLKSTKLEIEALEKQVEFWKSKALESVR